MRNTAVAAPRRVRRTGRSERRAQSASVIPWIVAGAVIALLLAGFGLLLVSRTGASSRSIAGSEHSLGLASAPVIVEEWSDFE